MNWNEGMIARAISLQTLARKCVVLKIKRSRRRGDWAMQEIRLIHRLRPEFNSQHKGRRSRHVQD